MTAAERIQEKIQKLRALHENATQRWRYDERVGMVAVYPGGHRNCLATSEYCVAQTHFKHDPEDNVKWLPNERAINDQNLIVAMRNALPALLDVAEAAGKYMRSREGLEETILLIELAAAVQRLGEPDA